MENALFIIKDSEKISLFTLVVLLRCLVIYGKLIITVISKNKEISEKLIKKLRTIFKTMNIPMDKYVLLKYVSERDEIESDEIFEFIKQEVGKIPDVLISDDPEIYKKFYGKILIDHLDGLKQKIGVGE